MQILRELGKKGNIALFVTYATIQSLTGCAHQKGNLITAPQYSRAQIELSTPDNIKENQPGVVSNSDFRYGLEEIVLYGEKYFAHPNDRTLEDELDFMLVPSKEALRIIDPANGALEIKSKNMYIPSRIKNENNEKATKIKLAFDGKFGIKADMTKFDTENVQAGVVRTTQNDMKFGIKTIKVRGREYFVPQVEDGNTLAGLPFYVMQVDGAKYIIDSKGMIEIQNSSGIYRPAELSRNSYDMREPPKVPEAPITPLPLGESPGKATEAK